VTEAGRAQEEPGDRGDTLQLLVGGGRAQPEMLLLIERPMTDGRVRVRSWTSDDWAAPPSTSDRSASELLAEIERWSGTGRTLNHPLAIVRRWLEHPSSS
jgi:hypothetical protein